MREGFAVAIREDALVRSPLEKLDPRELPKPRSTKKPRRLDDAELERLLAAAKTKTPGYHALFVLLAFTGLRIREALALTWADIDLDEGLVRVERQLADDDRRQGRREDRERAPRAAALPAAATRARRAQARLGLERRRRSGLRRRPPKAEGVPQRAAGLPDAVKEAKITVAKDERLSPHSMRHTYTSHLIVRLELDAATASKLAGHADPGVTMRVYADDFRKATERNAAVLARAAERGFGT